MAKGDEKKQPVTEPVPPSAADQQAQTTEADATTIGALHEMIMVVGDQTAGLAEQLAALAERMTELENKTIGDVLTGRIAVATPQIEFDPAWLDGLVFKGARTSGKGNVHEPFERKARRSDVLKWSVSGDDVTIVLADGSKHQVER